MPTDEIHQLASPFELMIVVEHINQRDLMKQLIRHMAKRIVIRKKPCVPDLTSPEGRYVDVPSLAKDPTQKAG